MKPARFYPVLVALALAAILTATGAMAISGKSVVEHKCSTCHTLKRLCRGLDLKDKKAWAATVDRMVTLRGARLSPQEASMAYHYLILQTSKSAPFCK